MRKLVTACLLAGMTALAGAEDFSAKVSDMRGDGGLLRDFGPTGAVWVDKDNVFVCDRRYTTFHIFDTNGRRFRLVDNPRRMGEVNFNGMCGDQGNDFFVTGSHYHVKNNPRYLETRSAIYKMTLHGEELDKSSAKDNYRPDRALRASKYYGESSPQHAEVTGIAFDRANNRVFFAFDRCLNEQGEMLVMDGRLDKFLERSDSFELTVLKTGLVPEADSVTGQPYRLSDIAYLPGKGLVLLTCSQSEDGRRYGTNQLWFMKDGVSGARLAQKDIAIGNRATGLAIRPSETEGEYQAALVCDNDMEFTQIPSRMVYLRGLRLPMR